MAPDTSASASSPQSQARASRDRIDAQNGGRAAHDHGAHDHKSRDHEADDHEAHDHEAHDHEAHDHEAHDHVAHDDGAHDHGAHDHKAHDHEAHDHGAHGHGAHDHAHGFGGNLPLIGAAIALAVGYAIDAFAFELPWWSRSVAFGVAIGATAPAILPSAWSGVVRGRTLGIHALVAIATMGAVALGDWSEGATVAFLFAVGEAIEGFTFARTRRAVSALLDVVPATATVVFPDGSARDVAVRDVPRRSRVVIKPGERIPIDGVVYAGSAAIDQAPLTGESLPVDRGPGDEVYAGTVNLNGHLEIETTRPFDSTAVATIVRVASSALTGSTRNQRLLEGFARWYTPAVVLLAIGVGVVSPLVLGEPVADWFGRALVLVLVACPCALLMASPIAVVAAVGNASRHGVVVRTARGLEAAGIVDAIGFDKTGTLTHGTLEVVDVVPANGEVLDARGLLQIASSMEALSEHPVGVAIARAGKQQDLAPLTVQDLRSVAGSGVTAMVGGQVVAIGRAQWITSLGGDVSSVAADVARVEAGGRRAVVVAMVDSSASLDSHHDPRPRAPGRLVRLRAVGTIAVADRMRPEAREAIDAVRARGVREIRLVSGDAEPATMMVATRSGIAEADVRAALMPDGKVEAIRALGAIPGVRAVAMVGDGINDAMALAVADVGIAMGSGSAAIARDVADVTIVADDLRRVAWFLALASRTRRIISANVAMALGIKLAVLVLATAGFANLWLAIAADTGATVLVALNGSRLLGQAVGGDRRPITPVESTST